MSAPLRRGLKLQEVAKEDLGLHVGMSAPLRRGLKQLYRLELTIRVTLRWNERPATKGIETQCHTVVDFDPQICWNERPATKGIETPGWLRQTRDRAIGLE